MPSVTCGMEESHWPASLGKYCLEVILEDTGGIAAEARQRIICAHKSNR